MPAIAAVLFLVGMGMIQWQEIRLFARHRADLVVCWLTALTVCFVGLEAGLAVAAIASVAFFVAGASAVALETSQRDGVEYIAVRGNLFYASVDTLARHLRQRPGGQTRLDLRRVAYCDAAALAVIEGIRRERLEAGGQLNVVREDPKPARTAGGRALPAE
jgi:carbonic anhydrase